MGYWRCPAACLPRAGAPQPCQALAREAAVGENPRKRTTLDSEPSFPIDGLRPELGRMHAGIDGEHRPVVKVRAGVRPLILSESRREDQTRQCCEGRGYRAAMSPNSGHLAASNWALFVSSAKCRMRWKPLGRPAAYDVGQATSSGSRLARSPLAPRRPGPNMPPQPGARGCERTVRRALSGPVAPPPRILRCRAPDGGRHRVHRRRRATGDAPGLRRAAADLASTATQLDHDAQAVARAASLDLIWAAFLFDASSSGLDPHRSPA